MYSLHGSKVAPLKEQTVLFWSSWLVDVQVISISSLREQSITSGPTAVEKNTKEILILAYLISAIYLCV